MNAKSELFKPKVLGGFAQRGRPGRKRGRGRLKPPLTIKQILAWVDAHYAKTGKWPQANLGRIHNALTADMGHYAIMGKQFLLGAFPRGDQTANTE